MKLYFIAQSLIIGLRFLFMADYGFALHHSLVATTYKMTEVWGYFLGG